MAQRNDISIDWTVSPRIITIDAPSTEIIVQDLYDTLRYAEAFDSNMDDDFIVSAGGKEELGGGVKVGLTVTLNNALLAFEARGGPTYVQCLASGGNLVAVDASLSYFTTPIEPTAFTQVILQTSSSATLQELEAIQFSSFEGGVTVDIVNGTSGTEFPTGTRQYPSNNLTDAETILDERGFNSFYILGDVSITGSNNYERHSFLGEGANKTTIWVDASANVYKCEFYDCHLLGTLDGESIVERCAITDLDYVSGYVYRSVLNPGTITVAASSTAHIMSCYSGVPGLDTPILDLGGSGSLGLRDYNGGIKLINLDTSSANVSVDMNSGQVKLENSLTDGTIVLRGVGTLTYDYSNGATIVNQLVNKDEIAKTTTNKIVPFLFAK